MLVITARFIDVGLLEPALFHATYAGVAYALEGDDAPVVVWGRARPHISLGQSQDRNAELAPDLDVPVVTRPLGGGAVWVDESQYCFVLIAPLKHAPARPARWFEWGLAPAVETYQCFGLPVKGHEQDLWLLGRKIAGCGAATIGRCAVFASSFLFRFPVERFARCIASPLQVNSKQALPEFQRWLIAALEQAMTDWRRHQTPPGATELRNVFRRAVGRTLGWQLADSVLSKAEVTARRDALAELAELAQESGRRLVANGIKLNAATFLTEKLDDGCVVRELTVAGAPVRLDRVPA